MINFKETKSLIAYFSREGNNYVSGSIVNLPVGNTEVAAKMIWRITGSSIRCDQFIKGAEESGNHTEKIFLGDKKINYCKGCGACYIHKKACSQKDDMAEILDKMIAADVIVMATPVYFYTMDAQMKTLIDRTCSRYTEIQNKEFYFITTAADDGKEAMKQTIEGLRAFTSCLDGVKEKGIIYGIGAWHAGDINSSATIDEAYTMGKNI